MSGIVRDAFSLKGHDVTSCDLMPSEKPGKHYQGDVLDILNDGWDMMIAHPPCTFLTVTGNRWFKPEYKSRWPTREIDRDNAVEFFLQFTRTNIPKICIENPVGIMSSIYRKPDQIISPHQFGHREPKKTCLWLKGLPLLQHTNCVEPEYTVFKSGRRMGTWTTKSVVLSAVERTKFRSRTFQGIADAMANQWG